MQTFHANPSIMSLLNAIKIVYNNDCSLLYYICFLRPDAFLDKLAS